MTSAIFSLAHEAAFVAYVAFAVLIAIRGSRSWLVALLFAAVATTALWAQARVLVYFGAAPVWLDPLANGLRDAAWLGLSLGLMQRQGGRTRLLLGLLCLSVAFVFLEIVLDASGYDARTFAGVHIDGSLMRVVVIILGFVLVENIYRNSPPSELWSLKHLLIGLVCILSFQLISRIPEFLTHKPDVDMAIVRPLVFLIALPLLVVSSMRFPNLQVRVHSSRAVVFHSATLIVAGILLQGVAAAAWYVRQYGGSNATVLAVVVLFGGVVAIAVALVSGSLRARLRRFINENFFSLKYDYRVEWEKIIRELSLNPEQGSAERVLRTLCDLLDSPGGALWIHQASWHQYLPAAKISFVTEFVPIAEGDARVGFFRDSGRSFLDLAQNEDSDGAVRWRSLFPTAWIIVPFRYRSAIIGIAVLAKSRAPRNLDWEDENLIRLFGLQLGAYLAQEETAQSLADARQLAEFNKRFAFIVHDIKNTIGQLSLLVSNAVKFGHQPEFRSDMVETLGNAVERLQELLHGLTTVGNENVPGRRPVERIDLIEFLGTFTKQKRDAGQDVVLKSEYPSLEIQLKDVANLRWVIEHVVSNALEASGGTKPVEIDVVANEDLVEIKVVDQGTGMTEKFINEELFRPMRTTKGSGFGIGAYQARELMRDLGGDVQVQSKVGQGTCVSLLLPKGQPRDAGVK